MAGLKVKPKSPDTEIIRTTVWSAGPGCHGTCGVLAHIKKGKLVKIEGDPDHPWNQGRLCARCLAMTQYVYHPDRLTRPLKRVGERGEGKWQEISWEEAFDLIEERLGKIRKEFGPESVVFSMGTGRDISPWLCMLAYAYGSPNVMFALSGNACYSPRIAAVETVLGDYCVPDAAQWLEKRYDDPKYKLPKCIVIWGYNIPNTCPDNIFGHWFIDLMKRGVEIVCMDPRLTWFSSRAKHWLRLRPGTDGALAMGFLNTIISEDLYDHEFVEKWTNAPFLIRNDTGKLLRESDLIKDGLRENFVVWDSEKKKRCGLGIGKGRLPLRQSQTILERQAYPSTWRTARRSNAAPCGMRFATEVSEYPLERVSEITWVPKKDIQAAARFFAQSKPAVHPLGIADRLHSRHHADGPGHYGSLVHHGQSGSSRRKCYRPQRIRMRLVCACPAPKASSSLSSKEADQTRIGIDKYGPFQKFIWRTQTDTVLDQIFCGKPYPIKALWMQTGNIIAGIGFEPKKWRDAFKKLDFIAAVDLFMTPTTQYADVVLPAATFLEKDGVRSWWVPLQTINKAISVEGCKPDVEINFELASRFDPNLQWKSVEESVRFHPSEFRHELQRIAEKNMGDPSGRKSERSLSSA